MMGAGMDPMAGIGAAPSGNQASTAGEGRAIFNQQIAMKNIMALSDARTYMGILSGCVAGVVGLTNGQGFLFFLVAHFVVGVALMVKMEFDVKSYSSFNTPMNFLLADIQKCGMGYLLFWTLFYSLCYLF
ncbi:hypothetical protein TrLO_g15977 [Triparma laevis f. longispina]|uniref:ER membrane protein complex subunit 6 n=1 Tax=Triparma laevis f. longispina TaxID=1714387 RepID=A0A9W7CPA7_9STRA|nr:hypothetical protein TrLO_g15977 [Triparma laevis f. longispina]